MKDAIAVNVQVTVQTSAMTTLRPVGGRLTLPDLVPRDGASELMNVTVQDADNQKAAMTILFFSADFATAPADNAAFTLAVADLARCLGKVEIATTDYTTVGGKAVATKNLTQPLVLNAPSGSVFAVALIVGTPTYAGAVVGFVFGARRMGT